MSLNTAAYYSKCIQTLYHDLCVWNIFVCAWTIQHEKQKLPKVELGGFYPKWGRHVHTARNEKKARSKITLHHKEEGET